MAEDYSRQVDPGYIPQQRQLPATVPGRRPPGSATIGGVRTGAISQTDMNRLMAMAANQQRIRQAQTGYQTALQRSARERATKDLMLRVRQSQADVGTMRRKAEFEKTMGEMKLDDAYAAARAGMINQILQGVGSGISSYMVGQGQQNYWDQYMNMLNTPQRMQSPYSNYQTPRNYGANYMQGQISGYQSPYTTPYGG